MRLLSSLLLSLAICVSAAATPVVLPGFRLEPVATSDGFVTSVVVDTHGTIYFTTLEGAIRRVEGTGAVIVATLPTHDGSDSGLLGMVLLDDNTAAVHYTKWLPVGDFVYSDVISRVDLTTGAETVLHEFVGDVDKPSRGVGPEHHGGNPTLGPDGSVFVGIGEYNGRIASQDPRWNGGKIWRINPDGSTLQWSLGMRNPYDLAWDPDLQLVVLADNGWFAGDEIDIVPQGANCGWPLTYGSEPPVPGTLPPAYVFPMTVAPTGFQRLSGTNPLLRRGYLIGGFSTKAVYYMSDVTASPIPDPPAIFNGPADDDEFVIDVTEAPSGEIYVGTAYLQTAIYRLVPPARGDCNGDGVRDGRDVWALRQELADGDPQPMEHAQDGAYRGSWGCDANADGLISSADMRPLINLTRSRRRAVIHR